MDQTQKRAEIHKAQEEAEDLRQRLELAEAWTVIWKHAAEYAAREADARQATIDRLMLEYCPDEMTQEQIEQWAASQRSMPYNSKIQQRRRVVRWEVAE